MRAKEKPEQPAKGFVQPNESNKLDFVLDIASTSRSLNSEHSVACKTEGIEVLEDGLRCCR